MERVQMVRTCDGRLFERPSEAVAHLDRRIGDILSPLSMALGRMNHVARCEHIMANLDKFEQLIALERDKDLESEQC